MDRYIDLRPLERRARQLRELSSLYWLWGLLLIGWGVVIMLWPEVLVAMVAALFIAGGIAVLARGWLTWSIKRDYERFKDELLPRRRHNPFSSFRWQRRGR